MKDFRFESLADCPEEEAIALSDAYHEAKIIDSPKDYFRNLPRAEQEEILAGYKAGKHLRVLHEGKRIGFLGHGVRPNQETIMIFYLLMPEFRGRGLFTPMMDAFCGWCAGRYPDKKFLRANTEVNNTASIRSLQKAGFEFLEEKMGGPDQDHLVPFHCFVKKIPQ